MAGENRESVEKRVQAGLEAFTRAERQLAMAMLQDYPASAMGSITTLAQRAEVSAPTVTRMLRKIGFEGFHEFQGALRDELSAMAAGPIVKQAAATTNAPDSHMLNRFSDAVHANMRATLAQLAPAAFDACARLLADSERSVYVTGGRITRALAEYFFTHLQVIRPGVAQLGAAPGVWPHYVLEMSEGDVIVLFDIRRYENTLLRLAELAHARGAKIILFTDQWGSPISKWSDQRFTCHVEAPSAWDSSAAILFIVEALIAAVQELAWESSKSRMEELEDIFDSTRLFRKFV